MDPVSAERAFTDWWNAGDGETAPAGARELAAQAWAAGLAWALDAQNRRAGSDLRGRVVTLYRPLTEAELARENPELAREVVWPALHLDDDTLVYAAQQSLTGGRFLVPAQLVGQKRYGDEIKKVSFNMQVVTREAGPSKEGEEGADHDA